MKKISFALALAGLFVLFIAPARAVTFTENFTGDPLQNGWRIFGDTNLFQWNSTNQNLAVTWDSSQPDSYFYHPLGTILAIDDDFTVEFDLQLSDAMASGDFEMAAGLFNFAEATNSNFSRANADAPNLFEFDYFPDGGFGPSIDATLSDMTVNATNEADFYFAYDTVPLNDDVIYHVILTHVAGEPSISGEVLTNGQIYTALPQTFPGPITDFRLDTISISSYTSTDDPYGDSILAHGVVDNFVVTLPPPPVQNLAGNFTNNIWQAQFISRTNWLYTLERSSDLRTWTDVSPVNQPGNGTNLFLPDPNAPMDKSFYRVSAERP